MGAAQKRCGSEGCKSETRCQLGLLVSEYTLKFAFLLLFWMHNINSCERCLWLTESTLALHARVVTCMSSMNKRAIREVAQNLSKNKIPGSQSPRQLDHCCSFYRVTVYLSFCRSGRSTGTPASVSSPRSTSWPEPSLPSIIRSHSLSALHRENANPSPLIERLMFLNEAFYN